MTKYAKGGYVEPARTDEPTRIPITRIATGAWILPAASIRRYGADFFRELAGRDVEILAVEDVLEGDTEA